MIKIIEVFDPAMCCSTGVCGPSVAPALVKFASDLKWLESKGVEVRRFNLSQQPKAFAENKTVKSALKKDAECLPLILVKGKIVSQGNYPPRAELASFLDLPTEEETGFVFTPEVAELVAIGASISANCLGCFKYHHEKAVGLGISGDSIDEAVNIALVVKKAAGEQIQKFADHRLQADKEGPRIDNSVCCTPSKSPKKTPCCG